MRPRWSHGGRRKVPLAKWPHKQLGRPRLNISLLVQLQSILQLHSTRKAQELTVVAHCKHAVDVPDGKTARNPGLTDHSHVGGRHCV
jgi:hypothetical protein